MHAEAAHRRRPKGKTQRRATNTNFSSAAPSMPASHAASFASLPPYQQPSHTSSLAALPTMGGGLPPFQFLRLKSFSPHTDATLRKLETAVQHAPSARAFLDLAEEYRVLGARHSYLRVLEYGKVHFPYEASFRTLLYQHHPNRPRTPPPQEPAVQMERTSTYDYKWRHREQDLFPKDLLKLDTSVPTYGTQLREYYLQFLNLLRAEEAYQSPAEQQKCQSHTEAMRQLQVDEDGNTEVALALPAHFNRDPPPIETGRPAVVPGSQTPADLSWIGGSGRSSGRSSGSSNGRKMLSPSADQRRRESATSPMHLSPATSSRRSKSREDSTLAHLTPEEAEQAREEALEAKWRLEEEQAREQERREQEDIEWREQQDLRRLQQAQR